MRDTITSGDISRPLGKHDGTTRPLAGGDIPLRWNYSAAPAPRIDMPPSDSGESTGAVCPIRATHPARDQINESTAFSESLRSMMRPGERSRARREAIPGGSTSAFRKPPRIPVVPLLTAKGNTLEGGTSL